MEGGIGLWRAVVGCEGRLKVLKDGGGLWRAAEGFEGWGRVGEDFFCQYEEVSLYIICICPLSFYSLIIVHFWSVLLSRQLRVFMEFIPFVLVPYPSIV